MTPEIHTPHFPVIRRDVTDVTDVPDGRTDGRTGTRRPRVSLFIVGRIGSFFQIPQSRNYGNKRTSCMHKRTVLYFLLVFYVLAHVSIILNK